MKPKNFLSWREAWSMLLCGQIIGACRLSAGAISSLRHEAMLIGRKLRSDGQGVFETLSLT